MNRRAPLAMAIIGAVIVAACSTAGASPSVAPSAASSAPSAVASTSPSPEAVNLTIFGAASLSNVLKKVQQAYAASHAGTTLTISTDSSAALETQIEEGAPADVFLAADTTNPQKLVDANLSAGAAVVFAANKLTIVVPSDNPGRVASPKDLAKPGLKVIAAGDAVPISRYAQQLIDGLAKQPDYPTGFASAYAANVVSKEDNVKAIISKLEIGQGDAGIVYVTDAAASTKVKTIDVPDAANVPASYAGVVVGASTHQEAARTFLGWLTRADGQAVLQQFGFLPPSG